MKVLGMLIAPIIALAIPVTEYTLYARDTGQTTPGNTPVLSQQSAYSGDVTKCHGYYVADSSASSSGGLLIYLTLKNNCSAYGEDISYLTVSVEYETNERLHVHLYDNDIHQYQVPEYVLPRPGGGQSSKDSSNLQFDYVNDPFEFWITRKTDSAILFDTRSSKIPTYNETIQIEGTYSNYTVLPSHPLVFEDQYLQISSALPKNANIYGLGEVIAQTGYRRNSTGTVQTFWARDVGDPVDENMYGVHPMYMEVRWNEKQNKLMSHGIFLLNSNGMDVILRDGVIQYRAIGGTFDFYVFSGPAPNDVAAQYAQAVGYPQVMPEWSFGFHLCRWGYTSINDTRTTVQRMRAAGIPLEVQWNDIDWMRAYREFQYDQNYAPAEYKAFVDELHSMNQHYIPIIDAAIGEPNERTNRPFDVYSRGHELDVWMKNPDGTEYVGAVWPGFTVFPDWFNPKMQQVWTEAFQNLSKVVDFDGIWLDMNEPSSFVDGSATNSTIPIKQTTVVPPNYTPQAPPVDFPEGYWPNISGYSGNITVNGTLTYGQNGTAPKNTALRRSHTAELQQAKRWSTPDSDTSDAPDLPIYIPNIRYVDEPPYPIRNQAGRLSAKTVSPNATHYGGLQEYNVHNLWGTMEELHMHNTLLNLKPGQRPFMVARSTFAGIGRKTAHWLGDNYSTFAYMKRSIQGVLQFNLFGIPMVGPDTCGFNGNSDEEVCNRWMQLSAFFPFYRNHNTKLALSQEPYVWESVRDASIKAINARYSLLPYWQTLFAKASEAGLPVIRPLFHEFQNENYLDIDAQFLIGPTILVTPVLQPNESTVNGIFPSENGVFWVDWWTHAKLDNSDGKENVTLDLPLGNIGVHVRSGSVLLIYDQPEYTVKETRDGGYGIIVVLDGKGYAEGDAKIDDGSSYPVTELTCLTFVATENCLTTTTSGNYHIDNNLKSVTIIGVWNKPSRISLNGQEIGDDQIDYDKSVGQVKVTGLRGDLNNKWELKW
uniref:Maltase n=1 Tax=Kwoniella pini CBS 10737 TaxID=1296096 RepID=A0A1B9I6G9_9TREE|nr:alpha-glucosidase [Kwoniella pini CBS 10737]OCF51108.1 alpha-glucosidase [Kwoniella pini CBS 10737]